MDTLKQFISEQVSGLFPRFDALEVCGFIDEKSHGLEIFFTIDGVRRQCYEMIDHGDLSEKQVDEVILSIAKYVRTLPDYVRGELYNVNVTVAPKK